jgi:hypothetical protein
MSHPRPRLVYTTLIALAIVLASHTLDAAIPRVIRLRNAFIGAIKNRAAIADLPFIVDHVKDSINGVSSGAEDGDLHVSGRPGPFIAMPMVAEVVNARLEKQDVVSRMQQLEGGQKAVNLSGVWRLWFEHPPSEVLIQGGTVPVPVHTNPDHVFEIHPITSIDGAEADESFVPIENYTAYDAETAFGAYERLVFKAKRNQVFTTITSTKVGYNYTEFDAVLAGKPFHINDATFAMADIRNSQDQSVVARPIRLVVADTTKVSTAFIAKSPVKGTRLEVIGIPRVNLDKLVDISSQHPGETVAVKGAYEIIVIGIR